MGTFRRTLVILATFCVSTFVVFLTYSGEQLLPYPSSISKPIQLKLLVDSRGYLLDTPGCKIPDWDPYDAAVLPLFEKIDGSYVCSGKPHFLIGKPNATVVLDEKVLSFYYGVSEDNLTCTYRPVLRDPGPEDDRTDNKFSLGPSKSLELNVPLPDEFIQVSCDIGNLPTFTQYIPLVPIKPEVEEKCNKASNSTLSEQERLNVIIVGIDSVSKLNFLRHFRKTHRFLMENLAPVDLKGYTKVADNTFPNLVPLLTGHFIEHYWNESLRNMFFDNVNFIWKNYTAMGYRTLFAEDAPSIATFNYLKKGFKDPPADYYFRPFALAVEKSRMKQLSRPHCFQSELEMEVLYGYLKHFVVTMGHRPYFSFTFAARLTHDKLNSAGYADEPTFRLLRELHDTGALNKSVMVLFSDHGIRFGPIRQTYIGKFEERMPFIYLLFPPWFLEKYPNYARNLRTNQGRLSTPFDVHATLLHLINLTSSGVDEFSMPIGMSLLNEIPANRTCAEAAILTHWCPCQTHTKVPVDDPVVEQAALAVVNTINEWLLPYQNVCAALSVQAILDARLGQANDVVLRFVKHMNDVIGRQVVLGDRVNAPSDYLLTLKASPSGGIFEGTVRYDEAEGTFKVLDDISRINLYGNQSACVTNAKIRKFCYCQSQNQTVNVTSTATSAVT